ncbi:MAG: ribosome recycling factor [Alphaproteobacteria bacterium]|nr:ribosome recycling factor [Alphaproteobacteria bacterium]
MTKQVAQDVSKRMDGALHQFKHNINGLRTGRASANLLDNIRVDAYGDHMPINQLATVNVPEARLITVQVWDSSVVSSVEKAIKNAQLGLNPMAEGSVIRINIPDLSEERRKELVKVLGKFSEEAKIAMRNVRRDGIDVLKKLEKEGDITEDELHSGSEDIQKITDDFAKLVEEAAGKKEAEIMKV